MSFSRALLPVLPSTRSLFSSKCGKVARGCPGPDAVFPGSSLASCVLSGPHLRPLLPPLLPPSDVTTATTTISNAGGSLGSHAAAAAIVNGIMTTVRSWV